MEKRKEKLLGFLIAGGVLLIGIVYGIIKNNRADNALKDYVYVNAIIIDKEAGRSHSNIYVEYTYGNTRFQNEFSAQSDTFKLGQNVRLKVSKKYPGKYIELAVTK